MLIAVGERPRARARGGQGGGVVQLEEGWEALAPRCPGCDRASFLSPDIVITACSCGYRRDIEQPTLGPETP